MDDDGRSANAAQEAVLLRSLADEAIRSTVILQALTSAGIPLDSVTVCALDILGRHLSASLDAAAAVNAALDEEG